MKPVALPTGVLEEFQCGRDNYFQKAEKKSPRFTSVFSTSFLYLFHILFPVENLRVTKEFFNHSDLEFLEIPTEFRLEKQMVYLHSFVASLHPIWFGHEGDVLIISHQLVPLMLKYFIYSSTR